MTFKNPFQLLSLLVLIFLFTACSDLSTLTPSNKTPAKIKKLRVTATAYTSSHSETDKTPYLAAWGNRLRPGVKSIAVSRDLLAMGLRNGSVVRIKGLSGTYKVLDKMNKRWRKKIDIYMGTNRKRALRWGRRPVVISWEQ